MSLLAGYDVAIEVSNPTLLRLIEKNLLINGVAASPPFELYLSLDPALPGGQAHLVAQNLELDLLAGGSARLTVDFDNGSVLGSTLNVTLLAGQLVVTANAGLFDASNGRKQVGVDLSSASVDLTLDAASLGRLGSSADALVGLAKTALTGFVNSMGVQKFGPTIPVVAGQDGGLHPEFSAPDLPIQLESLNAITVANPDRNHQALVLLGTVFVDHHGAGHPADKTTSLVSPAHGFTLSISESTFDRLFFCPLISARIQQIQPSDVTQSDVAALPPTCGHGSRFVIDDATFTAIAARLATGHVALSGSFEASGFCYSANGSLKGRLDLTLSRDGKSLVPSLHIDHPDLNVSLDWECALALGLTGGALGGVVGAVIAGVLVAITDAILNAVGQSEVGGVIGQEVGQLQTPFQIGDLSPVVLTGLRIAPEGLSLLGKLFAQPPAPAKPGVSLAGSVVTTSQELQFSSTYQSDFCPKGTWSYQRFWQNQKAAYDLDSTLLGLPLQVAWSLAFGSNTVPLDKPSGTAVLPNQATFAMGGSQTVSRRASIGYTVSGTHVELTNNPGDLDYGVVLQASAIDPTGTTAQAAVIVQFVGDQIQFEAAYYAALQACLTGLVNQARQSSLQHNQGPLPPLPGIVDPQPGAVDPSPEQLSNFLGAVVASGAPEASELASLVRSIYGASLAAAFAIQSGLRRVVDDPSA